MRIFLFFACCLIMLSVFAQPQKAIQKSWIKTSIENLSNRELDLDTLYLRYSFQKSTLQISFYPGWNEFSQTWSIKDNEITIGFEKYKIEQLTDSSLIIASEGFRRMKFVAEDYLNSQDKYLIALGEYKSKPLYQANKIITPRYTGKHAFRELIQKDVADQYNIARAAYFKITFIVTAEGKVENLKIANSISEGFDNQISKAILKTSGDWKPAQFKGRPVQTEMYYDIKYLDSVNPFR